MQTHMQMHLRSLNLTLIRQTSKGDEWEWMCSAQRSARMINKPRATPKNWPTSIYRRPQQELVIRHLILLQPCWPDVLVKLTGRAGAHTTYAQKHDRTRKSRDRPNALVKSSSAPVSQWPDAHARRTGRHSDSIWSFLVSLHAWPDASGWTWPDAPLRLIRRPRRAQTLSTNQMRPVKQRPRPVQHLVTSVTSVRLRFFASGAVENRRFISWKAMNPASQARREGERKSNPSLPLKLHRLRKCANITKCTSPCACVLAFSQTFLSR
jgi:hypothetical protein